MDNLDTLVNDLVTKAEELNAISTRIAAYLVEDKERSERAQNFNKENPFPVLPSQL